MIYCHFKKITIIIGVLLLSACFNDADDTSTCTAPAYNTDGSLTNTYPKICYQPKDIQDAYQLNELYDMGLKGATKTVVLVDAYGSQTAEEDFSVFHETFFPDQTMPEFKQIFPDDIQPDYSNEYADGWGYETTLDMQWSHAIAPEAAIHVVVALSQAHDDLLTAVQYAVDHYEKGTVVSMSFGFVESEYTSAEIDAWEAVFKEGNDAGLSFFAATGDFGTALAIDDSPTLRYDYPVVSFPASSAYVTAIGGTFLQYGWRWFPTSNMPYLDANKTVLNPDYSNVNKALIRVETVWNGSRVNAATGGGISTQISLPDWQSSVSDIIYENQGDGRGIPDLAWSAAVNGGVLIYRDGVWLVMGGTSASTPQVAAYFSLVNQYLASQGMNYIGFLNPWLYQINDENAFNDIVPTTLGTVLAGEQINNQVFTYLDDGSVVYGDVPGYPTTEGWDMTTGFGSPRGKHFLDALVKVMLEEDN